MMKIAMEEGDNGAFAPLAPAQPATLLAERLRGAFMSANASAAAAPVTLRAPKWIDPAEGNLAVDVRDRQATRDLFAAPERPVGGAVAELEEVPLIVGYDTKGDGVAPRRAKVWRIKPPKALADLTPDHRMALEDYADAVHRVGASGGTSDPTGSGGGTAGARCPSMAKLAAVESLRAMLDALEGGELLLRLIGARGRLRGGVRVTYAQLVHWVAVDHLEAPQILRVSGFMSDATLAEFPKSAEGFTKQVRLAVATAAERLLHCDIGLYSIRRKDNFRNASGAAL